MFHARRMAHAYNLSPRESRTWTEWNPVFKLTNTVKAKNQNINKQNIFLFKLIFQGGLLGKQILRFECRKCVNIFRSISGGVKVARLQRGRSNCEDSWVDLCWHKGAMAGPWTISGPGRGVTCVCVCGGGCSLCSRWLLERNSVVSLDWFFLQLEK